MKITVNRKICQGHLACVQLAPETFQLDLKGKAVVKGADSAEIVQQAAHACPVDAILIEE
jgi:ferredoxin